MRTVIVTRERPASLERLLLSLHRSGPDQEVLVIDDSPSEEVLTRNAETCKCYSRSKMLHISRRQWQSISQSLQSLPSFSALMSQFQIGAQSWNTPAARNIALVLGLAGRGCDQTFWLDDDVVVATSLAKSLPCAGDLVVIPLTGCPDYGRMTWLQWFFAIVSPDFCEQCIKSGWWTAPQTPDELDRHEELLSRYTELGVHLQGRRRSTADPVTKAFPLPWRAGHGAAFLTKLSLSQCPLFPPFYSEDLYWMRVLCSEGAHMEVASHPILHERPVKKIVEKREFYQEETGSLCAAVLQLTEMHKFPSCNQAVSGKTKYRAKVLGEWLRRIQSCHVAPHLGSLREEVLEMIKSTVERMLDINEQLSMSMAIEAFQVQQTTWRSVRNIWTDRLPLLIGDMPHVTQ